ncbi:hypothetical protein A2714_00880 [Candidatus Woesebacteria bacterium RIFCSPHIGHO2_01_FULL_38_9]|uniref:Thioredoxin domain-containing protein n=1 Tax=Candidatus Woesebacteria bacterium RIFCSPHIGHO2_01_FULL_38_9 TaxID=1802492 RepID=A0A1F7XZA6_9BACT|nr:MAG: hypothetical protein A2714_00880 [Candidatus Woesebacteria bacterium RIFCSPHIGHO2_01_FULL_38_9]
MLILIAFSFLAGIVTILSPCILPLLPIILSSTIGEGKKRPFGVVIGFVASFTFFTLFLSSIVRATGVSPNLLRGVSILVLFLFGLTLIIPKFQLVIEQLFVKFARFAPKGNSQNGFLAGFVIGLSLGLLWTPCVGPILASVITLALAGNVTSDAFVITLAYAIGTAIPMFLVMQGGRTALQKVPWLLRNTPKIQKAFGILMILTAIGIFFNVDRKFQTFILDKFPNYGVGLTTIEDNETVRRELNNVNDTPIDEGLIGKPMPDVTLPKGPLAPELVSGGEWFGSTPLTIKSLRGKVVIIDFWTYSCINCQRTFPYLRTWYEKYKDKGLVIIGVHSPEFEFEKDPKNVLSAINDFDLKYPIMQDNNFSTWRAYNNRFWPAKYFIDKDGFIRYTHFGEGAYDESERVIQKLLAESGAANFDTNVSNPSYQTYSRTPEIYLGYKRLQYFASPEEVQQDILANYSFPEVLTQDNFALEGDLTITPEYSLSTKDSKLKLSFEAKEVFLVMNPKIPGSRVRVLLDGQIQYPGEDVVNGIVIVDSDNLYKLIKLDSPGRHELTLEFLDGEVEVYAFTFG